MALRSFAAFALLASSALARTDLEGCTSSDLIIKPTQGDPPYASVLWYVPGTGEICEFLDCGGGRAPPKTTVPGCPLYKGTATYSPRYISTAAQATPTAASSASASAAASSSSPSSSSSPTGADAGVTSATASAQVTASPSQTSAPSSSSSAAASSASDSASASASQTTQASEQTTIITTAPAKPTLQPSSGSGKNSTTTTTLVNGAVPAGASGLGSLVIAGVAAAAMMM